MVKMFRAVLPLLFSVCGCSAEVSERDNNQTSIARQGEPISTDRSCTASYGQPAAGLEIVYQGVSPEGQADNFGFLHRIVSAEGDLVTATRTMLFGADRSPVSTDPVTRMGGLVTVTTGEGTSREYAYGKLSKADFTSLKPGETYETSVVERSDFQSDGPGIARGMLRVTFLGCANVDVAGQTHATKVFDVKSAARAMIRDGAGPPRDETVQTSNRYWVSEEFGWPLIDETNGAIVATQINTN